MIDPGLVFITNICLYDKPSTKYIITTRLSKEELIEKKPELATKELYTLDCIQISIDAIGKSVPNAPMLGALMKVSGMLEIDYFLESFQKCLARSFPKR